MISRNLTTRIAVAVIAIPVILWIAYEGGVWLRGLTITLALLAGWEMLTRSGFQVRGGWFWLGLAVIISEVTMATGGSGTNDYTNLLESPILSVLLIFFISAGMFASIGKRPSPELFERHAKLVWGVLYVGLLYPFVYKVGTQFQSVAGGDILLFLFALLWIGDTAAMAAGKVFGKHKLAPSVSPNKTVEGFLGHIVFCLLIAILFHFWRLPEISLLILLGGAFGVSIVGQLGDLVESMWKRSVGIKDSSALIPGHGGVLDRFDSLLFGAPFLYAYLKLFII